MDPNVLLQQIYDIQPQIIYFGIGSANNQMQQCPPFLIKMKEKYNSKIMIILIDPLMEDNLLANEIIQQYGFICCIYKEYIAYNGDNNIISTMTQLNYICLEHNVTLIYEDYSGYITKELYKNFAETIIKRSDQLIYGSTYNDDAICRPIENDYNLPFYKDGNIIKIFNPMYYLVNEIPFESAIDTYGFENIDVIKFHIHKFQKETKNIFENKILSPLRLVFFGKRDGDVNIYSHMWERFNESVRDSFKKMYEQKQFNELFIKIKEYYSLEKNIKNIIQLWGIQMTPSEFINYITKNDNPYLWINEFKKLCN